MKVVCIFPGLSKTLNSISYAFIYLKKLGVDLTVITSRSKGLKGTGYHPEFEDIDGIPVHRIYKDSHQQYCSFSLKYEKVKKILTNFNPDILFCAHQNNLRFARRISKDFGTPIILFIEFARNPLRLLALRRRYLGIKPLAPYLAKTYWLFLARHSAAIITSYIGDKPYLQQLSKFGTPVYYIPWCNQIPQEYSKTSIKHQYRGVFACELSKFSNSDEFIVSMPLIFAKSPVREFMIIGSGPGIKAIKILKQRYGEKIKYMGYLPRINVLHFIEESFFGYLPARSGGWGFIGECWALKTPLIAYNHYSFNDRKDALLLKSPHDIVTAINELYKSRSLYKTICEEGYKRYEKHHTAKATGEKFFQVFQDIFDMYH